MYKRQLRIIAKTQERVDDLTARLDAVASTLRACDVAMDNEVQTIRQTASTISGRYAMELSVCDANYYETFLEKHGPGSVDAVAQPVPAEGWVAFLSRTPAREVTEELTARAGRLFVHALNKTSLMDVVWDLCSANPDEADRKISLLMSGLVTAGQVWWDAHFPIQVARVWDCLLYTSPSPRD